VQFLKLKVAFLKIENPWNLTACTSSVQGILRQLLKCSARDAFKASASTTI
jgi:hypothetical protein